MATKPQQQTKNNNFDRESTDGKPLDFSFRGIKDLKELQYSDARQGERKPKIEIEDNKEDAKNAKDNNNKGQSDENKTGGNKEEKQENIEANNDEQKGDQDKQDGDQKDKEKTNEKGKEEQKKGPEIIRIIPQNNLQSLIQTHNVSMNQSAINTKGGNQNNKNYEENKNFNTQKKVVRVKLLCTSLMLCYNKISSLRSFYEIIDSVMFDCQKLQWIDLSHNLIEKLDYDFSNFQNLKFLYLHCNYLYDLKDLNQLSPLNIRTMTIHGNPIETIPNFRLFIISMLPNLKKLDTVLVSNKERDNSNVMRNLFNINKIPEAKNPIKPPEQIIISEKDKQQQSQQQHQK